MIIVTAAQIQQIETHAQKSYPQECCGLLLGKITSQGHILVEVRETENSWSSEIGKDLFTVVGSRHDRFYIAPEVLLQVQKEVRERQLSIIGVYHSHPDHQAIPSKMDLEIAWSEYSYIIVSVEQGQATDLKCWKLDEQHHFQFEAIVFGSIEERYSNNDNLR